MTRPAYSTANLFMLFLLSYNILLAITISYLYWGMWHGTPTGEFIGSPWFLVINQAIGLLLPMFIFRALSGEYRRKYRQPAANPETPMINSPEAGIDSTGFGFTQLSRKRPLGIVNILLVMALSLLLQPFMMLFSAIASIFLPNPVTGLISDLALLPIPAALIIVALTPAICEELVFRGFIQSKYENQPIAVAAVMNGLFFGMIHMNLHQFAYAFAMGIVFAYMVYFTRSVYSAILAHFIVNATQYLLGYLAAAQIVEPGYGDPAVNGAELWQAIGALGLLSLFILPGVVCLFYIFVKHNQKRNSGEMNPGEIVPAGIIPADTEAPAEIKTLTEFKPQHPFDMKSQHPFDLAFVAVVIIYGIIIVGLM